MNLAILNTEVQAFIAQHLQEKPTAIALKKSPFTAVNSQELAQQLLGKQKAKNKLPTWFASVKVYYPLSLHVEQTSSEKTAHYKAQLVSGNTLIDCTGGLGVDSVAFSKTVNKVYHCELNKELQQIAAHNFKALNINNVKSQPINGIDFALQQQQVDWLYIDPSRRSEIKGKVFLLEDCLPNVPEIIEDLFTISRNILVKTAPILDISAGVMALKYVKEIHVVAVNNEVKELLWVLEKGNYESPKLYAASIFKTFTNKITANLTIDAQTPASYSEPLTYLYEPYAAVMKMGMFNWLTKAYEVPKLHPQTHLYTSSSLVAFPGRKFKVEGVFLFNKKNMKPFVKRKTNVVARNFKLTVAELRKKYQLQEGDQRYLFFVTNINQQSIVIDCVKQ